MSSERGRGPGNECRSLHKSWVAAVVLAALVPAVAAPSVVLGERDAFAQGSVDDAATVEARKRFQEGVKLFDEKKFDLAAVSFAQAYALRKHPAVLINLAESELRAGKPFDAAGHFKDFLHNPATSADPKRGEAEQGLAEARQKLGRIQVTVDLPDADVSLDGNKIGTSPLTEALDVLPGVHQLEAKKEGKRAATSVTAAEGKIVIADLKFNASAPAVVPVTVPTTTPTTTPPPAKTDDAPPLTPPPSTPIEPSGHSSLAPWTTTAIVGAGVGGAGLILGVAFLVAGNSAQSNADSTKQHILDTTANDTVAKASNRQGNPCATPVLVTTSATGVITDYRKACTNYKNNLDSKNTDRNVETVGFVLLGVGAVALAAGLIGRSVVKSKNESALVITPVYTPQMSGIGISGNF